MSNVIFKAANTGNFKRGRTSPILYIVIHYTANNGDTAAGNAGYFERTVTQTSAHYFVDESPDIWQTVQEKDTAWHCGTSGSYKHPECRNDNSIGIELCSRKDDLGRYYFKYDTVSNAVALVKELMSKYGIPAGNVLRHYDVTGKCCPVPFVEDGSQWREFRDRLASQTYQTSDPESKQTVKFDLFGKTIEVSGINKDGTVYVASRELLHALGFLVHWDDNNKTSVVRPKTNITTTAEERFILEKIVEAEAAGEDNIGKILVVNVIMNRVKDSRFPNNIKDVVFAPQQFEPTRNGAYDRAVPSKNTIDAVQHALCGSDYSRGAVYFRTITGATEDCWHEKALTRLFNHGGHRFYK